MCNVGIKNAEPEYDLDVKGLINVRNESPNLIYYRTTNDSTLDSTTIAHVTEAGQWHIDTLPDDLVIRTDPMFNGDGVTTNARIFINSGTQAGVTTRSLTSDTTRLGLMVDSANRVGIGNTAPNAKLHINHRNNQILRLTNTAVTSDGWASTAQIMFDRTVGNTVDDFASVGMAVAPRNFHVYIAGADRMNIDKEGNVVIGTNQWTVQPTFTDKLHVLGSTRVDSGGVDHALYVAPNGRVGVHNDNPTTQLDVHGDIAIRDTHIPNLTLFNRNTNNSATIALSTGPGQMHWRAKADDLVLRTSSEEASTFIRAGKSDANFGVAIDSNNYVGIGQFPPTDQLHVLGTFRVETPTEHTLPGKYSKGPLRQYSLYVDQVGNVGVNTNDPQTMLNVYRGEICTTNGGTLANSYRMVTGDYGVFWRFDGNYDYWLMSTNSGDPYGTYTRQRPIQYNVPSWKLYLGGRANDNPDTNCGVSVVDIRTPDVTNAGFVGVGTTDPAYKLDVRGPTRVRIGTTTHALYVSPIANVGVNTDNPKSRLHVNFDNIYGLDSGITVTNEVNQNMDISANYHHNGMIKCEAAAGTFYNALSVTDGNKAHTACIRTDGRAFFSTNVHIGGVSDPIAHFNSTFQLRLSQDSATKPASSTWTVSSDERLKEDIELADVDVCYENVKRIPLKYYKWRDEIYTEEEVEDRHRLGWIAQDVQGVFPKAIKETNMHGIEDCLSLNADQIYASMYGATQKLIAVTEGHTGTLADHTDTLADHTATIATMSQLIAALQQQNAVLQQQNLDLHARVIALEQQQQPTLAQDPPATV
jgi:hypothetical protein